MSISQYVPQRTTWACNTSRVTLFAPQSGMSLSKLQDPALAPKPLRVFPELPSHTAGTNAATLVPDAGSSGRGRLLLRSGPRPREEAVRTGGSAGNWCHVLGPQH